MKRTLNDGAQPVEYIPFFHSPGLRRQMVGLARSAFAILDLGDQKVVVGSGKAADDTTKVPNELWRVVPELHERNPIAFTAGDLTTAEFSAIRDMPESSEYGPDWECVRCTLSNGCEDVVAFRSASRLVSGRALKKISEIWGDLSRECIRHLATQSVSEEDEALLWTITNKINLAVVVLRGDGTVLKTNTIASQMLHEGGLLRQVRHGLESANASDTRQLRQAISECADPESGLMEQVVFLKGEHGDRQVPVTLSRFTSNRSSCGLVIAVMPIEPESEAVRELARRLGLTHSEARVASLLQLGMTNRQAAPQAGLTEQSFATYAKRVLCKLNANNRTEVAQMLTWQVGGRMAS